MSKSHHHQPQRHSNIKVAFFLNLAFTVFEILGGFFVNSIAILSDALHDLGDSLSLGLSWFLHNRSQKKADNTYTFGYRRFSLLGALINSIILIAGSMYVITEAIERLFNPQQSNASGMLLIALVGIIVNGYAALKLSKGRSLNERIVSWHLLEDVLGWAAVLIASVVLLFKDVPYLDPALSILITLYILYNVIRRLKETFSVFLQAVPKGLDPVEIKNKLLDIEKVQSLHHVHIWSLEGEHHVFTAHLKLKNIKSFSQILKVKQTAKAILKDYHFSHYTIEVELDEETCDLADETA